MKYYIVIWLDNFECKSKIFKNRKSADKFGCKMMYEHNTSVDISTYIDTECISTEHFN